ETSGAEHAPGTRDARLQNLASIEDPGDVRSCGLADQSGVVFGWRRWRVRQHGDAIQLAVGHAQVSAVDAKRLADFILQELRDRATVHATQDFTDDMAVIERVIRRSLA